MKINYWIILLFLFLVSFVNPLSAQEIYDLESPNGKILTHIRFSDKIDFEVLYGSKTIVGYSTIAMNVGEGIALGKNPKTTKTTINTVDRELYPVVPLKSKVIRDNFNEAHFKCKVSTVLFSGFMTMEWPGASKLRLRTLSG